MLSLASTFLHTHKCTHLHEHTLTYTRTCKHARTRTHRYTQLRDFGGKLFPMNKFFQFEEKTRRQNWLSLTTQPFRDSPLSLVAVVSDELVLWLCFFTKANLSWPIASCSYKPQTIPQETQHHETPHFLSE